MRGTWMLALGVLVAGCTGPGVSDFRALAIGAPALLAEAAGPNGDLAGQDGTMELTMQMTMEDQAISMVMPMRLEMDLYQGGAYLMEMTMEEMTVNGERMPMDVRMRIFCSPATIFIDGGSSDQAMDPVTVENPLGFCPVTNEDVSRLSQAEIDASVRDPLAQILGQGAVPALTFKAVEREGTSDVAVYEYTMDMTSQGMTMQFTVETRSHLEGARIASMELTGTGTVVGAAGGQSVDADIGMTGSLDYRYGARSPIPAEFA